MTAVRSLVARMNVHGRVMDAVPSATTTVQTRAASIAVRLRNTWTLVARMYVHSRAIDADSSLIFISIISHHTSLSHHPKRLGSRQPPSLRQPTTAEPTTDRPSLTMRTHRRRRARRAVRPQARNASRIKPSSRIRLGGRAASAKPPHWAISGRAWTVLGVWAAIVPGQGQEAPPQKRVSRVKGPAWTAPGVATK
jgi:hypothetical protein